MFVIQAERISGQRARWGLSREVHIDELRSHFARGLYLVEFDVLGEPALGTAEADHVNVVVDACSGGVAAAVGGTGLRESEEILSLTSGCQPDLKLESIFCSKPRGEQWRI